MPIGLSVDPSLLLIFKRIIAVFILEVKELATINQYSFEP